MCYLTSNKQFAELYLSLGYLSMFYSRNVRFICQNYKQVAQSQVKCPIASHNCTITIEMNMSKACDKQVVDSGS